MKYIKPELIEIGSALEAIQSNLSKGMQPNDQDLTDSFTNPSAYVADE